MGDFPWRQSSRFVHSFIFNFTVTLPNFARNYLALLLCSVDDSLAVHERKPKKVVVVVAVVNSFTVLVKVVYLSFAKGLIFLF